MSIVDRQNLAEKLENSISKFLHWLAGQGFESYDHFDFWGSPVGIKARRWYLEKKWLAAPLVLGLQLLESFLPRTRVLFARKKRFAIGDAHFALGYLNLFHCRGKEEYLAAARDILDTLLTYKTETPHGIGWGYPYDWVTRWETFERGTPFITVTPYCFEAFLEMYNIGGEAAHLEVCERIAGFAAHDLEETRLSGAETAATYSPLDKSRVYNANTYRAALLAAAGERFNIPAYTAKALQNVRFVVNHRNSDGSWDYAPDSRFIDNFHTCFVLKNLFKVYSIVKEEWILEAVKEGFACYRRDFFRGDNTPIHMKRQTAPRFRKIEMYDYAEAISLGVLLKDHIPGALELSQTLAADLIDRFQVKAGYFVTRVTPLNTRNKIPYLRWPQAQLFFALTSLLRVLLKKSF